MNLKNKTVQYIIKHKLISGIVSFIVLLLLYYSYNALFSKNEITYVIDTVKKSTIVSSISASGQVSTLNEINIKPKVSGDIVWVGFKAGDNVSAGQIIAYIDSTTAKENLADAIASLDSAKLQYQKDSAQAPIDYQKIVENLEDSKNDLTTSYNDVYNTVSSTYLDLPSAVTGMQNVLYGTTLSNSGGQWNIDNIRDLGKQWSTTYFSSSIDKFAFIAEQDYKIAREKYDKALIDFKSTNRSSGNENIEKLLVESIDTTVAIAQALQSEINMLDTVIDESTQNNTSINSNINTMRTSIRSSLTTVNNDLSSLLSQQKNLDTIKKNVRDNERSIQIYKIGNNDGGNPISLQSSAQSIMNQERNIEELKRNLYNYNIVAPFAGTLASVDVKKYDTVSSGTEIATLITDQKVAELSLNEVDVAKINIGDKAVLTFDAIDNLTLTGEVIEIDSVGTVSQGVVSYKIKISFDSQDERIKSGMTVNGSIQTDVASDVLVVPSSAVKTQNGNSYIQVFDSVVNLEETNNITSVSSPKQIQVTLGISDDTNVQIIDGVEEGRQIIIKTVSSNVSTNTTNSKSNNFGGPGIRF